MTVEISIRKFFTTDSGVDLVPKTTYTVDNVEKFAARLPELVKVLDDSVADFSDFTGEPVREMTDDERKEYLEAEDKGDVDYEEVG